jgi:hypothetical protein
MDRRVGHLVEDGLAQRRGQQVIYASDLINTLRRRDLEEAASKVSAETGLAHSRAPGRRRLDCHRCGSRFPSHGSALRPWVQSGQANIIAGPAAVLKPGMTPRTFREPEEEEDSVFNYVETASDRVGIGILTERLVNERVAIICGGGTGGYILDFVAKTPVREIRLFDSDEFLTHNAFRAPGAPSLEELREAPKKVDYLKRIYSRMHRNIVAHDVELGADNLHLLDGVTFAFLSLDAGDAKRLIVEKLEAIGAAFVDVGMGLELDEGSLGGILRVTASTPEKRDHARQRISFVGGGAKDIYASNIQVADLNVLNAVLAVVKWKKIRGFYRDLEREHHCTYTTDGNMLINGDLA